ncbi:hypothetical protein DVA86_22535 [Streptomyces armeniacus]|uniref:Insertion element IS402-like domain-containing protein n=1 Tax=Streptomyces armeniacus TaxID=83291 RepID=A0A345XTP2_9ACTN|nr:hypothetical protein DVA86_22535 [Streptomyces armeniacus]
MSGDVSGETARGEGGFDRETFVEEMGLLWEAVGSGRMDGRIIAYLLITDVPYVSSAQLAGALRVSAGSISLATRRLAEAGFLKRHAVPGERSRYFRVDDDVWGSFLAGERRYLDQQQHLAEQALALLGPDEEAPRRRLRNMRDYMRWIRGSHRDLLARWRAYQRESLQSPTDDSVPPGAAASAAVAAASAPASAPTSAETAEAGEAAGAAGAAADLPDEPRRMKTTLSPVLARHLLPDALWQAAEPLLIPASPASPAAPAAPAGRGGGPRRDRGPDRGRADLTAVVYVLTSGCGWQQLPDHFGLAPATAHRRFTAWSGAGFWRHWLDAVTAGTAATSAEVDWCAEIVKAAETRRQVTTTRRPDA